MHKNLEETSIFPKYEEDLSTHAIPIWIYIRTILCNPNVVKQEYFAFLGSQLKLCTSLLNIFLFLFMFIQHCV